MFSSSNYTVIRCPTALRPNRAFPFSKDIGPAAPVENPWDCGCLTRRIELGAERESFLQVFDEDAYFGRQPAASRSNRKDRHDSFVLSQKTDDSTFSEFCCEEPCGCLSNPQVLENTHPHLFNIAGTKDSCGDNTLRVLSRAKDPRLYGPPRDKNNRWKAAEIFG